MKKSFLLVIFVLVIAIIIVGCGSPDEDSTEVEEDATSTSVTTEEDVENGESELSDSEQQTQKNKNNIEEYSKVAYSPFSGNPINKTYLEKAVMFSVENSVKSRPQSGLAEAPIVYEFLVEGGVTRFLALYWGEFPEKIGPIRSARPYLIETAKDYNALLVHAGASPRGFAMLNKEDISHLDQINNGKNFWRGNSRKAPHNLYTGSNKIKEYVSNLTGQEYDSRFNFGVTFYTDKEAKAKKIKIQFLGNNLIGYKYDEDAKNYKRFYSKYEIAHLVDSQKQLTADNIIVQFVQTKAIDKIGRLSMDLKSGGKCLLFKDGIVIEGYWEKEENKWTKYYNQNGEELKLNPGRTWIEMVPTTVDVEY